MNSYLYDCFIKNIKKNPEKKIIYSLDKSLNGVDCLKKIKKIINYLKYYKIQNVGIRSRNNPEWILWYLASKKICNRVFIFNRNLSGFKIKKIACENKINLIKTEKNFILLNNSIQNSSVLNEDILFTSGTTDEPKGVIIKEKSYIYVAKLLINKFKQCKNDIELLSMPFEHSFGLARLRCNIISGSSMLVTDGLKNFPEIYNFSNKINLTGISLVPSGVELVKFFLRDNKNNFFKKIRYFEIGSSFLNIESRRWLKRNFKKTLIYHHYGSTEASRSFLIKRGKDDNLKSEQNYIGKNIKGTKIKIVKSKNNTYGELLITGKNLCSGYLNDYTKSEKFHKGWFKTGDLVKKVKGKIILIGRSDNQINIGGNKIYPEIIERKIEKKSYVSNVLCFPEIDKFYGSRMSLAIEMPKINSNTKKIKDKISSIFINKPDYLKPKNIIFKKIETTMNGKKIRNTKYS